MSQSAPVGYSWPILDCPPAAHLYIAVPAYTGLVCADTSHSINEAVPLLIQAGIKVSFNYICGCCYLDHARNMLVTQFLRSDATDLLFVDADLGFAPEAALKIAAATKPFIAGVYRKKNDKIEWPLEFDAGELWANSDGYLEAAMVPTGFLRLNRAVFDAMPHVEYRDDHGPTPWMGYFDAGVTNGEYLGEDVRFCRDWRARGGKIHIIPELTFAHNGMKAWTGSWGQWKREQMQNHEAAQ